MTGPNDLGGTTVTDDYPDYATLRARAQGLAVALQSELLESISSGGDDPVAFVTVLDGLHARMQALQPLTDELDEHFAVWREGNELWREAVVEFDLDIWDLFHDRPDSPWKTVTGRAAVRAALARELEFSSIDVRQAALSQRDGPAQSRAVPQPPGSEATEEIGTNQRAGRQTFYYAADRRDARDATLAAFDKFGVVVSYRHLFRYNEDRDDNPDTPYDVREEPLAFEASSSIAFRHPRRVDFRVYRLAPGPDGREVLKLEALRHENVVDEASSYDYIPLVAGEDSMHEVIIETHPNGALASVTRLDESERAARLKAFADMAESQARAIAALAPHLIKAANPLSAVTSLRGVRSVGFMRQEPSEDSQEEYQVTDLDELLGEISEPTPTRDRRASRRLSAIPMPKIDRAR